MRRAEPQPYSSARVSSKLTWMPGRDVASATSASDRRSATPATAPKALHWTRTSSRALTRSRLVVCESARTKMAPLALPGSSKDVSGVKE